MNPIENQKNICLIGLKVFLSTENGNNTKTEILSTLHSHSGGAIRLLEIELCNH